MPKKSPIKQKILQYLEQAEVTEYEFYQKSGISRGVLKSDSGITEENIARFLAYDKSVNKDKRVSLDWLVRNEGPMFEDYDPENVANEPKSYYGYRKKVRNLEKLVEHLSVMTEMFGGTLKDTSSTLKELREKD